MSRAVASGAASLRACYLRCLLLLHTLCLHASAVVLDADPAHHKPHAASHQRPGGAISATAKSSQHAALHQHPDGAVSATVKSSQHAAPHQHPNGAISATAKSSATATGPTRAKPNVVRNEKTPPRSMPSHLFDGIASQLAGLSAALRPEEIPTVCRGYKGWNSTDGKATLKLLSMLRPCLRCASYKRFGGAHDGGYVMCADAMSRDTVSAGYSFGINGEDEWGADISQKFNVPVYEFDCVNQQRPKCSHGKCKLHFIKECIGPVHGFREEGNPPSINPNEEVRTLRELLMAHPPSAKNSAGKANVVVKMDVEGAEWASLDRVEKDGDVLQRISQIVIELHSLSGVACHPRMASVLRRILDAGFVVAHIHGNNFGPMNIFDDGRYIVPEDLEVTLVNKQAFQGRPAQLELCSSKQDLRPQDARNNWYEPELALAELPSDKHVAMGMRNVARAVRCRHLCTATRMALAIWDSVLELLLIVAVSATISAVLFYRGSLHLPKLPRKQG